MSAYIVSKAHIDALVSAAMSQGETFRWYDADGNHSHELSYTSNATHVGVMLWGENLASVNARYPDTIEDPSACPGPSTFQGRATIDTYVFKRTIKMEPVQILKAIHCYEYQSCEHSGWKTSEAHQFCRALEAKMISALPGYDKAPWGLREDDVRPGRTNVECDGVVVASTRHVSI